MTARVLLPQTLERDGGGGMFHSGTREVLEYWDALRVAGHVPERAALDPMRLSRQAGSLFMAEIAPGRLPLRLTGELWASLWGGGLKRRDLLDLFAGSRDAAAALYAAEIAAVQGEPLVLDAELDFEGRLAPVQILFAPLRGVSGRVDRLFGLLQPLNGETARLQESGPPVIRIRACRPAGRLLALTPTGPMRELEAPSPLV